MQDLDEKEMLEAEDNIERALGYFRHTEAGKTSMYKRNLNRNIITREMRFLRENFPESYILNEDLSDVDLTMEVERKIT